MFLRYEHQLATSQRRTLRVDIIVLLCYHHILLVFSKIWPYILLNCNFDYFCLKNGIFVHVIFFEFLVFSSVKNRVGKVRFTFVAGIKTTSVLTRISMLFERCWQQSWLLTGVERFQGSQRQMIYYVACDL